MDEGNKVNPGPHNNGANLAELWTAFAKRGMGWSA